MPPEGTNLLLPLYILQAEEIISVPGERVLVLLKGIVNFGFVVWNFSN